MITSPGSDGITAELVKNGGKSTRDVLYIIRNKILSSKQIRNIWDEALASLLFKKGDRKHMNNYRP